jgi:hypothetical protein
MKTTSVVFLILASTIAGCGLAREDYYFRGYQLGQLASASVGDPIMSWETGTKNPLAGTIVDGVKKVLMYTGIDRNVVHVSYREFQTTGTGEYARQAFTSEFIYDLSQTNVIVFQDIRIKVESATAEKITYTVLKEPEEILEMRARHSK